MLTIPSEIAGSAIAQAPNASDLQAALPLVAPLTIEPLQVPSTMAAGLGTAGASLTVRRAWPRGPGRLLLELADGDGAPLAGQWIADPERLRWIAAQTALGAPAGAVALVPGTRVLLQARGADRRLAVAVRLAAEPGASLLLHRPERRAVLLRVGVRQDYCKLVRPGRTGPVVAAAMAAMALARQRPAWAVPQLTEHDPASGAVTFAAVPGISLRSLLEAGTPPPPEAAAALGRVLRALHTAQPPAGLPVRDAAAELAWAATWVARVEEFVPRAGAVAAAHGIARAQLGASPPGRFGPIHADLHDGQVLLATSGGAAHEVGLLDWDTLALGEAALDLATLLVRLEMRTLAGAPWSMVHDFAGAVVEAYAPPLALRARVLAYAPVARLRLACQYAFRPAAAHLVGLMLGRLTHPPPGL